MIVLQIIALVSIIISNAILLFMWFTYRANRESWRDYENRDLTVKRERKPW